MTEKSCFIFAPESNVKIIIYMVDKDASVAVLIGCWLFDCRKKHPLYVHAKSPEILNVLSTRNIKFLKEDGPLKLKFEKLLKENDYMRYGL